MRINCYIGTYNQLELATGAAKSLRANILYDINITLICSKELYSDNIFDKSVHIPFSRWCGCIAARQLYTKNEYNLYIDDDIRLLNNIIIENYDKNYYYLPSNGQMVHIWSDIKPIEYLYYQYMKVSRVYSEHNIPHSISENKTLSSLIIENNCEIIDDIWLHLDKGSQKQSLSKKNLISYIDS